MSRGFAKLGGVSARAVEHPEVVVVGPDEIPPLLRRLLHAPGRSDRVTHVETLPERVGRPVDWPGWVDPSLRAALEEVGIARPWAHQVAAAGLARAGRNVVLATGTASGKSLGYLLPGLTAVLEGRSHVSGRGATVLYLSPTKALAADQLRTIRELGIEGVRAATYDGDTAADEREWVRDHAS